MIMKNRIIALFLAAAVFLCTMYPVTALAATYRNDDFRIVTSDLKRPAMLKKGAQFKLDGSIKSNRTIEKIGIYVKDCDNFKNEIKLVKSVDSKSLNLKTYNSSVDFSELPSGVKELIIKLYDEDGNCIKLTRGFTVLGKTKEPVHITDKCKISVSRGSVSSVTDSTVNTYWTGGKMTIVLPDNKTADGILIKWHLASNNYTLKSFDKDGKQLDSYNGKSYNMLHKYYELDENAAKVIIDLKAQKNNNGICTLRVYEKGRVGASVERWEAPTPDDCDLMVVSAHRDDELLFFGGTIPYYQSVEGKKVITVYMSGRDRVRIREALAGQWSMGTRTYPIFLNFAGGYHDGISGTLSSWGGEDIVLKELVERIRKFKPKVIVTHDSNGEYGHPTHKTTSYLIQKAIKLAADDSKYKESYEKYGSWQVNKLYLHMEKKNKITLDWNKKSASLDGKTPYQLACIAFDKHISQHGNWSMSSKTVRSYPNNEYGLVYTNVGKDKYKNDFFENIDD